MKITLQWLHEKSACKDAVNAWIAAGNEPDPVAVVRLAMKRDRFDWANWLIVRCMTYKQYVAYAVFAAEQVINIYEKKYPNDDRPRKAIEAARACIANPSKKNKAADAYAAQAAAAAYDAYAYAYADAAAYAAAYTAAYADADAAAHAAAYAADAAATREELQQKIILYGIALLKQK